MARRFRLWEKKRGDRRTGSKLAGTAGEGLFFAAFCLFGSISLAALILTQELIHDAAEDWAGWVWLIIIVLASLIAIGAAGLVYTILLIGTTAERRHALAKRATNFDLLAERLPSPKQFPNVPRDANLRNSPGIKLAYRLPITRSPGWRLLGVGVFSLVWNGMVSVLGALAVGKHIQGNPDWYLTTLVIPFAAVGIAALYFLFRCLLLATAIGPTSLEISNQPIHPGRTYRVYVTQAGRLSVSSLSLLLVCDEEATYRQGTDTRTERKRVFRQTVFKHRSFDILPGMPYEYECELEFPENIMHSFRSDHNAIQWRLVVRGTVEKWSNFERVFPLVVYPRMQSALAAAEASEQPAA